ncbi:restriction endonuclease subunit S [Klebsiella pneumoniae]|uniref:restriction endonuclease subunit S n=1 Tax=Gammaproteobacteria TaxID=1236 RepID=UPI000BDD023D|nr:MULTISPECIES: restriction endonuclease subunit S [Gammaproteobacteria]EAM2817721.1 restriction endonuclease subunit S [Salmonella enterica]EKF9088762.1 restriction endonuclease subunit S [Vibrio cholerae]EAY5081886.1 restriction endonuclease subunit S [Salmonella enterica]MDH1472409.1 restriction endonuclease subunit S [Shewanella sp. GD03713]PCP88298.1 restriction endonuclease subunit S [Klebsiella pneumoniae]
MTRPYTEYQQSDISWLGKVPKHWAKNKFKFLLNEKTKTQNLELPCGSISFGHVVFKDSERLSEETKAAYQEVLSGEFLVNPLNLNYDLKSLRTALADIDVIVSSGYIVLKSLDVVDKAYLRWLLYLFDVRHMKTLGAGIRQTISFKDIADCAVYIPNDSEQKAIATFLDHETQRIDSLIEEKQTVIKLLKEKRQALISHVVTKGLYPNVEMQDSGIEWIGQVPKHWSVVQLKRLIDSIEQGWSPECLATPAKNERWGVLKSGAVNGGVYSQDENKELPETLSPRPEIEVKVGDLIMSRASGSRELIGSAAYVYATRERLMLSDKLFRLHCKEDVDAEFVAIALGSFPLRRQIELAIGGAEGLANNLSQANIKKLLIPKPPKTEQEAITSHIKSVSSKIEDLIIETNNSIALLKERKTSLISAAVTGKIDVREAV